METILSSTYYPILKTVFDHLDLESLVACYNVSEEFRRFTIIRLKELKNIPENSMLKIFNLENKGDGIYVELDDIMPDIPYYFIDFFKDRLIKNPFLNDIIDYSTLSEEFVRNNNKYVEWYMVCKDVKLSEDFIREYRYRVNWRIICKYQDLSVDFIKEHKDFVCWENLIEYNKIPEEHFDSMMHQYKNEIEKDDWYWELQSYIDDYSDYI